MKFIYFNENIINVSAIVSIYIDNFDLIINLNTNMKVIFTYADKETVFKALNKLWKILDENFNN